MLVLIAQKKRLGALNATQKTTGPCQVQLLRKSRKTFKNANFPPKFPLMGHFGVFFWIFSLTVLGKDLWFLRCVQCPKTLPLSYQNQHWEIFSNFFLSSYRGNKAISEILRKNALQKQSVRVYSSYLVYMASV